MIVFFASFSSEVIGKGFNQPEFVRALKLVFQLGILYNDRNGHEEVSMALENKLGITSSAELAREEERISKKKRQNCSKAERWTRFPPEHSHH